MTAWVISQHGAPVGIITDEAEALVELAYLQYHGEGYSISKPLEVESTAGAYARGDQGEGPDPELSNYRMMSR